MWALASAGSIDRLSSRPLAIARNKRDRGRIGDFDSVAKRKRPLTTTRQLAIDLDKNLRVEQRAVPDPPRAVDAVAIA